MSEEQHGEDQEEIPSEAIRKSIIDQLKALASSQPVLDLLHTIWNLREVRRLEAETKRLERESESLTRYVYQLSIYEPGELTLPPELGWELEHCGKDRGNDSLFVIWRRAMTEADEEAIQKSGAPAN